MQRPRQTEPSYRESQILLALDHTGTTQVELCRRLGQKPQTSNVSVYVNRLREKGLVQLAGTVKQQKNGRHSRIVVPTTRGKEVISALREKGVK